MIEYNRAPALAAGEATVTDDAPPCSRLRFRAMGCDVTFTIAHDDASEAQAAIRAGRSEVERLESMLSRFRPDSELSRLNARAGMWTAASPVLATLLRLSVRAARDTGGLCTPTVLSALLAAGYDRDFSTLGEEPRADNLMEGLPAGVPGARIPGATGHVGWRRLRRLPDLGSGRRAWRGIRVASAADGRRSIRLPHGSSVDLGGIAKGWTADRLASRLATVGPALVDLGGDLAARGSPNGRDGWLVSVADPRVPDRDLSLVVLRDAGIATSGTDYRRWNHHGRSRHHVIDPRTGVPARTDVLSASVIAPTAAEAEVHAKVALILGTVAAQGYLRRRHLAALLVRDDGEVCSTPRWSRHAYSG